MKKNRATPLHHSNLPEWDWEWALGEFGMESKDKYGCTPLHYSVTNFQKCNWLLEHGANPNAQDKYGSTPLFRARNPKVVELLIHWGADKTIRKYNGCSVWDTHKSYEARYVLECSSAER